MILVTTTALVNGLNRITTPQTKHIIAMINDGKKYLLSKFFKTRACCTLKELLIITAIPTTIGIILPINSGTVTKKIPATILTIPYTILSWTKMSLVLFLRKFIIAMTPKAIKTPPTK